MRSILFALAAWLLLAPASAARPLFRSYLTMLGGVGVLTGRVSGDVLQDRATGLVELGVGYQLNDPLLLEFTYGWMGRHEQDPPIRPLGPTELGLSEAERAYRVTLNPLFFRLRYAPNGHRSGYVKPELALGLGWMQVTRLLRNIPSLPPAATSQLQPALELGVSALLVFSRNFMGYAGGRYTISEREAIVDDTDHLDGLALFLGFRSFLPSPRDVEGR